MLIYSSSIPPRLWYIAEFIKKELGDPLWRFTTDKDEFFSFNGIKLNYSDKNFSPDDIWMKPDDFLFETGIRQQAIELFTTNNYLAFFKTEGSFPFDIFSACFYLLSRYEEYLPHTKDIYGRYAHENSLAFRQNFLQLPLVNIWLRHFREFLLSKFHGAGFANQVFRFFPTYDIDEAFSYKYKGCKRSVGGAIKDILNGRLKQFKQRGAVLLGIKDDPFNSFAWIDELHSQYPLQPHYFFLVADTLSKYDRNIHPSNKALQKIIKDISEKYQVAVHPSWQSGDNTELIKREMETIKEITKQEIYSSRQHFIRFILPETYRRLINAGIKEDFSMGYGSINGFRASVASPFYWYDLENEQATDLLLYPFCYMEANSFYEQKFSSEQALEEMIFYCEEVKKVDGMLVTIWHNTFLGTDEKFKGWREAYQKFFCKAAALLK